MGHVSESDTRRQILLANILRGELLKEARPQELFVPVPGDVKGGSYSPFEVLKRTRLST